MGHGAGLGDQHGGMRLLGLWGKTWGQRAGGTWGGFRGQAGTRGCDKGTSGDTGLGLGDQQGGLH